MPIEIMNEDDTNGLTRCSDVKLVVWFIVVSRKVLFLLNLMGKMPLFSILQMFMIEI